LSKNLTPTSHILLDARPENIEFAQGAPKSTVVLLASQCHPSLFDALADHPQDKLVLWHASIAAVQEEILNEWFDEKPICLVGGGGTVGLRAMYLAHLSGFRRLHCYGMDSSYAGDEHHAFAQPLNDGEDLLTIMMAGKSYRCSAWMARQANEFNAHHEALAREGTRIVVHGKGLIPDMCRLLNEHAWKAAA
jgi:hypothetical protein